MKILEELYGQDAERAPPSLLDLCRAEYWNARPLWQSDLDHFASVGISGLDLANPDMVLKAGIILDDGGNTFVFEHHTDTDGGRDAFILPVEGASGIVDLIAFDSETGLLATWLDRAFAINEASIWEPNLDGDPLPIWP